MRGGWGASGGRATGNWFWDWLGRFGSGGSMPMGRSIPSRIAGDARACGIEVGRLLALREAANTRG